MLGYAAALTVSTKFDRLIRGQRARRSACVRDIEHCARCALNTWTAWLFLGTVLCESVQIALATGRNRGTTFPDSDVSVSVRLLQGLIWALSDVQAPMCSVRHHWRWLRARR